MTSEENKQIARRAFEALMARDLSPLQDLRRPMPFSTSAASLTLFQRVPSSVVRSQEGVLSKTAVCTWSD